jgi:hypothetical protein
MQFMYIYSIELQIALKLVILLVCHDAFVSQIWIRQFYLEEIESQPKVFSFFCQISLQHRPCSWFAA